jgi:hypothetical protein
MSTPTPFGACVEYLRVSHAELADLLSEGTGKPYSLHRAKMVCDGREPVPGFAWAALRELDRSLDTHRDQLLLLHEQSGGGRFIVSKDDFRRADLRRVLIRTMLKLDGGASVEMVQHPGPTFGWIGPR